MSAFVVSKQHIDTLICAGLRSGAPGLGVFTLRWHDYRMPAP